LLQLGVDTNIKDSYNFSPYGLALREEQFEVAEALLRPDLSDG